MVFALVQPAACAGLALGFVVALALRVVAQSFVLRFLFGRPRAGGWPPRPDRDVNVLGVLAALLTGTGFGTTGAEPPATGQWGRRTAVVIAGPLSAVLVAQILLAAFVTAHPDQRATDTYRPSDVLHGIPPSIGVAAQLWFSSAVALLCFGLIAALPIPPCDGWAVLAVAELAPSTLSLWLSDRRWGSWLLLIGLTVPLGERPALYVLLDSLGAPLIRVWSGALPCRGD
ncbi:hypothetical protein [Stackebrandtia soli]|uniref:hypothetical protein n=1 Tax=Stackebrandtia soli TaxID=1892856 RepID=UPI0039E97965